MDIESLGSGNGVNMEAREERGVIGQLHGERLYLS